MSDGVYVRVTYHDEICFEKKFRVISGDTIVLSVDDLVAEKVAAGRKDENDACAKVCDEKVEAEYATGKVDHNEMGWTQACAIAIRARREQ